MKPAGHPGRSLLAALTSAVQLDWHSVSDAQLDGLLDALEAQPPGALELFDVLLRAQWRAPARPS